MGDIKESKTEYISSHLPFWNSLSEAQKAVLLGASRSLRIKKDSVIHSGGDTGIILVRRGRLSVCVLSSDGRELVLTRIFAGGVCVLASGRVMEGTDISLQISSECETDIIIIDSATYGDVCASSIEAEAFTRLKLAQNFAELAVNMQSMLLLSPERKIAAFICGESDRTGSSRVKVTHEQLARNVGTAREVVSRTLGRLAQSGDITLERGVIVINDKENLRKLTEI